MRRIKVVTAVVTAGVLTAFSTAMVDASTPPEAPPPTETAAPAPTAEVIQVTEPETVPTEVSPATDAALAQGVDLTDTVEVSTSNPNQVDQDQTVVVTATVVADANTGSNTEVDESGHPGASQSPAEIATGNASAVGSNDANIVTQGAEITLQDQATANVLQVALILNVGVAFANSGYNGVSSIAGGAGITAGVNTGDADATGLNIDHYITQAARETGDEDTDAHANQLAISLWMGLGTANSGLNTITGTGVSGGSGGAIASGNASATGNLSTTDIDQYAELLGEDTAQLNVTQRATVLNVGFALANSGINDISGIAGGLLSADPADDNAYAQDLFAMLLPALLQSYGYGPAVGSITTGDATAMGNDSDTFVQQVALAAASGDGVVDIVQNVLVANVGAAAANTGGNVLGGAIQTLDPESASSIVLMAAFMSEMLALVHQEANGTTMEAISRGVDVPFQGLLLRLDATFEGLDTTYEQGGAQANMRQVTVIVSLGLANANSGHNEATTQINQGNTVNELRSGDAVQVLALDEAGNIIDTGDADAASDAVVVICQRINAEDIDCLEPPPPSDPDDDPGDTTTTTDPGVTTTTTVSSVTPTTVVQATTTTTVTDPGTPTPVPQPGEPGYFPTGVLPLTA